MASIQVAIHSIGPVADGSSVEALYRDLSELSHSSVVWDATIHEPPAAGFSEIANWVSFLADSKELLLPVASWLAGKYGGTASGKFHDVLSRCRTSQESGRSYVPMMIGFGTNPSFPSVRFFFHKQVEVDELRQQLQGMVEILEQLPEKSFHSSPGPTENGFFWDHKESRWRENYTNRSLDPSWSEEAWMPEKLFDDWA